MADKHSAREVIMSSDADSAVSVTGGGQTPGASHSFARILKMLIWRNSTSVCTLSQYFRYIPYVVFSLS